MLRGIQGQNATFLTALDRVEARLSKANNHLTTGLRVNQASDDPTAITDILKFQGQIDYLQQVQTNLATAKVTATTADGALQNASSILDQLTSIATQGASDTSSQTTRAQLGQQVQALQQQLVAVANTTVNGHYVFGGDDPTVAPFTFNWSVSGGVISNSTSGATGYLQNGDGSWITASMTASQVFNATTPTGVPASNNVFKAVYDLGQALTSNNMAAIQTAAVSVKAGSAQLQSASIFYGSVENWIDQAASSATAQLSAVQQSLSAIRETDLPSAITQLTSDQTTLQASLSAHASLSSKTLFDYFG